jgi:predicted pyridoxine 5'-phosphate oxidase superfamily flavin-nucleotide-binding protein
MSTETEPPVAPDGWGDSPWRVGERRVQARVGETHLADRLAAGIRREIPDGAVEFLAGLRQIVLAAADDEGAVWVTALTGPFGFLDVPRPDLLTIAATPGAGDPLAGVLAGPTRVGLVGLEPATRSRVRLNGRSRPVAGGLEVELDQVFGNCPKHIHPREVIGEAPIEPAPSAASPGLTDDQIRRLAAADTFFVGSTDDAGNADASHRGGEPGVIEVLDERHLRFPDYRGNSMYQTLGNLDVAPEIGLLVLDWATGAALHLTGRAAVDYDLTPELRARFPRAQRLITVELDGVVDRPDGSPLRWADTGG